jgi:hypothetical protein
MPGAAIACILCVLPCLPGGNDFAGFSLNTLTAYNNLFSLILSERLS